MGELRPIVRARLEGAIEHLIALLDALDGDPDFEPDADELGVDFDLEPDQFDMCGWPDEGSQEILKAAHVL